MLLYAATFLLLTVLRISQAHTTTTFPTSYRLKSTPLHSHMSPRISTTEVPALGKIEQGDPRYISTHPGRAPEPSSSASASPATSQCPPLQIPCGGVGCYDPNTDRCCDGKNICNHTHNCVETQLHNGTMAAGCCPGGTLACDDTCFDAALFRCCAAPGGAHGLCPADQDCCGNMCCDEGAVCASGFDGPMCWQRHSNSTEKTESSPGLPATTAIPNIHESASIRVTVPKIFHVLSLCVAFVASILKQGFPATRFQSLPTRRSIEGLDPSNSTSPLNEHRSCHAPMEPCGDGCYNPVTTTCCQQDNAGSGTCHFDDVCCQNYCCPYNMNCYIATGVPSSGPWCWPVTIPAVLENLPLDAPPWPTKAWVTGLKNTRIKNGSSGTRPSTLLYMLLLLLSLVAANSTAQLISIDSAAANVYHDSATTIAMPVLPHTLTRVEVDIDLPEKKGGGGGHGSGGHSSGGRGGIRPGGGAHSSGARYAIPISFLILIWVVLPGAAAML